MNDRIHDDVEAYVLGALDQHEAAAFEDHLQTCAPCRTELASYAPVRRALDAIERPVPRLPAPAIGRFTRARRRATWRNLALAASLALVVVGAFSGGAMRAHDEDAAAVAVSAMVAGAVTDLRADRAGVHMRVIVGPHGDQTAIVLSGLSAPSPGRGYQVWVNGRSPGMLRRARNGLETLILTGDRVRGARRIGVSDEPAMGSAMRTTPPIITVSHSA